MHTSLPFFPKTINMTPEFNLLTACSWVAPDSLKGEQIDQIKAYSREIVNWDAFISLVERHQVTSLVYYGLYKHGRDLVPEWVKEKLKERSDFSKRQSLRYGAELLRLIKIFNEQQIDVISLKGVMLSLRLYDDPGMRHMRDLDILIRLEDINMADFVLAKEGYRCTFPGFKPTVKQYLHIVEECEHNVYVHDESGLQIELHWRIFPWTPIQVSELRNHSYAVEWMGQHVNCLDDDALLLFLCDHGAHHKWLRLKWLSDVVALLSRQTLPITNSLIEMAGRLDLRRALAQSALLAHWIYKTQLPEQLIELVNQEKIAIPLGRIAVQAILMRDAVGYLKGGCLNGIKFPWYLMNLRSAQSYRLYLNPLTICIEDFRDFPLPDWLFFLYYPLRPFFWFWRHYIKPSLNISKRSYKSLGI